MISKKQKRYNAFCLRYILNHTCSSEARRDGGYALLPSPPPAKPRRLIVPLLGLSSIPHDWGAPCPKRCSAMFTLQLHDPQNDVFQDICSDFGACFSSLLSVNFSLRLRVLLLKAIVFAGRRLCSDVCWYLPLFYSQGNSTTGRRLVGPSPALIVIA